MHTFELMLGYTWLAICHAVYKDNSRCIHLCTRTKECLVHVCLHKMYQRVFLEQEVLHVLTELNTVEIARTACARITTFDFHSSSNRAVPYGG